MSAETTTTTTVTTDDVNAVLDTVELLSSEKRRRATTGDHAPAFREGLHGYANGMEDAVVLIRQRLGLSGPTEPINDKET